MKEWFADLSAQFYQAFIEQDRWLQYLEGLWVTIRVAFFALIIGIIIGVIVAVIRTAYESRRKTARGFGDICLNIANAVCKVYLTIIRGTPTMIQLLIMYFVIFTSTRQAILVAILTFGINSGAYVAEIVRSGIMSVDHGQMEAGRSLGLDYKTTMIKIVIPQAIKNILPALGNEMITLFKDTSLVTVIALRDLTKTAMSIQGVTYQAFMPLVGVAIVYLVCVIIMTKLLEILEGRLRTSDRR